MDKANVILLEVQPRDPDTGARVTLRLAGGGADFPYRYGGQNWEAGLAVIPSVAAMLDYKGTDLGVGAIPQALQLEWNTAVEAALNAKAALHWKDAPFTLWLFPENETGTLPPLPLQVGKVLAHKVTDSVLQLAMADPAADLQRPLAVGTFGGGGGLDGPAEWEGRRKRRVWGQAFNIEGEPIDPANNVYCFGDPASPWQSFDQVRDKGAAAAALSILGWQGSVAATFAALQVAAAPQGGGVAAPSIAMVKWWTRPAGILAADVKGETTGGYVETAASIAQAMVQSRAGPAFVAGTVAAANALRARPCGYVADDTQTTISAALDWLLGGVSLLWVLDAATGQIRIEPWDFTASVGTFRSDHADRVDAYAPVQSRKIGYRRNHRVHSAGDLAAIVTYGDGTPIDDYRPGEPGSTNGATIGVNVRLTNTTVPTQGQVITAEGTAGAIAGQGALATQNNAAYATQISGLPAAIQPGNILAGGFLSAGQLQYGPGGPLAISLQPAQAGADVTGTNVAAAITGQGVWATLSDSSATPAKLSGIDQMATAGDTRILNAALSSDSAQWVVNLGTASRQTSAVAGDVPAFMRMTGAANLVALNGGGTGSSAIAIRGGQRLFYSFLARADITNTTTAADGRKAYVRQTFYNAAAASILTVDTYDTTKASTNAEGGGCNAAWQLHTCDYVAPAAAVSVKVELFGILGSTGAGKFIDFARPVLANSQTGADLTAQGLIDANVASGATNSANLLSNGELKANDLGWWTKNTGGYATSNIGWASDASGGFLAFTAAATKTTYTPTRYDRASPFNKDDGMPVFAGRDYYFSFDYRSDGSKTFYNDVWFYKRDGTQVAGAATFTPVTGQVHGFSADTAGVWTRSGIGKITAPAGAEIAFLRTTVAHTSGTYAHARNFYFGPTEPGSTVGGAFGANLTETLGGATATLSNFKTNVGTAAAITGQGAFATLNSAAYGSALLTGFGQLAPLNQVSIGTGGRVYRDDGVTRLTDALAVTSLGTAAAVSGQSAWATYSGLAPASVAGQVQYLDTSGNLSALTRITDRRLTYLRRADGATDLTEAMAITALGTAAAITGQADWATYTGIDTANLAGRVSRLSSSDGRALDGRMLNSNNNFGLRALSETPTFSQTNAGSSVTLDLGSNGKLYPDWGGTITLPSATFTGLAYSTTYYVWRNMPPDTNGTSYGISTALTDALGTGKVYLGFVTTMTSGGSGGGGGGYGGGYCVAAEALVPISGDLVSPAAFVLPGEPLTVLCADLQDTAVTSCAANVDGVNECVTLTTVSGITLTLALNTPMTLPGGFYELAANMTGKPVAVLDHGAFRWESVDRVDYAGPRAVAQISCGNATYAAGDQPGRYIFSHNNTQKP